MEMTSRIDLPEKPKFNFSSKHKEKNDLPDCHELFVYNGNFQISFQMKDFKVKTT